jgi:hypothetical protein
MPEWARAGPISGKNYSFRAEAYCAANSALREGQHPTINRDSPEFPLWQEYFDRWLQHRPTVFRMLLEAGDREMTVPAQLPQWFDPSFAPTKGWHP